MKWYSVEKDGLPKQDCRCIVLWFEKETKLLTFNSYEQCWDDDEGDDYYCDIDRVEYYIPESEILDLLKV